MFTNKNHMFLVLFSTLCLTVLCSDGDVEETHDNQCKFGPEAIATIYDRFESFRTTKAFELDPNGSREVQTYSFQNDSDGYFRISIRIGAEQMVEYYTINKFNKIMTRNGHYNVKAGRDNRRVLHYEKREAGFKFRYIYGKQEFHVPINYLDPPLSKKIELNTQDRNFFDQLVAFRKRLFTFKSNLDHDKWYYVQLFDIQTHQNGSGFDAHYMDSDGYDLTVTSNDSENGVRNITGSFQCNFEVQDFDVIRKEIKVNGTPNSIFLGVQNTTFDGFIEVNKLK